MTYCYQLVVSASLQDKAVYVASEGENEMALEYNTFVSSISNVGVTKYKSSPMIGHRKLSK